MAKPSRAGATHLRNGLPEEIVVWEILVRLPPKSLLRCRAVCRAWRGATSTRDFLLAHHGRQPSLPIVCGSEYRGARHENFFTFDHRAADGQLQPVARLEDSFCPEASCDGLLILSNHGTCYSVCNPATHQHASLQRLPGFSLLGMYAHRPTGEYRLLLYRTLCDLLQPEDQIGCYVLALGSGEPPRYIEATVSTHLTEPALVRDSLHWYPVHYQNDPHRYQTGSKVVIVFDTTSESFRQMRAPDDVPARSYIFEMDVTLGIYNYSDKAMRTVDIWVLQNYKNEVWEWKYSVELPVSEMRGQYRWLNDNWDASVVSVDGEVLLLVSHGGWMFYIDINGELVDNFHRDGQHFFACELRLKQTLVQHTFFKALEGYAVNALPFV